MNKFFQLNEFCQCQVWLAELPKVGFEAEKKITAQYSSTSLLNEFPFKAAAEIDIFKGGRSVYGMLGAEFIPADDDTLNIELSISEKRIVDYEDALLLAPDVAYVGLPAEYSDAVLKGFSRALNEKNSIPAGQLYLKWAAHGEAYSNSPIFEALAYFIGLTWGQEKMLFDENLIKNTLII